MLNCGATVMKRLPRPLTGKRRIPADGRLDALRSLKNVPNEVIEMSIGAAARDRWDSGVADGAAFEQLQSSILERCLDAPDVNIEDERDRGPERPAPRDR